MANRKRKDEDESNGGKLTDYPNDKWAKFVEKFAEIETLPAEQWKPVHLLGYFCKKYLEAYQVNYEFKFNSPNPVKGFEIFNIKKIAMLLSSDPVILKQYIDWVYDTKVKNGKRRLTSISFMAVEALVNDYKCNVLLGKKKQLQVDRTTLLPPDIKQLFKEVDYVKTYGDLVFIYRALSNNSDNSSVSPVLMSAMEALKVSNFDFSILDRIV